MADIDAEEKRGVSVLREETVRLAGKSALCELIGPKVEWLAKDGELEIQQPSLYRLWENIALAEIVTTRDPKLLVHLHRLISLLDLSSVPASVNAALEPYRILFKFGSALRRTTESGSKERANPVATDRRIGYHAVRQRSTHFYERQTLTKIQPVVTFCLDRDSAFRILQDS